jgi:UDP-4-amino-4,6-dideoxy-N-acetyl-beta-L-altrosamine N-acetyltransferase
MSLRRVEEGDLGLLLAWRNAPKIRVNMFRQHEISEAEHLAWFDRVQKDTSACWLLYFSPDGVPSGIVNFTGIDIDGRTAHWGFYAAPGRPPGTGTRLSLEALDHAFISLGLRAVLAEVLSSNSRSLAFHRKLGFREQGCRTEDHEIDGARIPVLCFELDDDNWRKARITLQDRISSEAGGTAYSSGNN